jgi:UrcA family protein
MKAIRIASAAFLVTAAVIKAAPALAEPVSPEVNVALVHTADLDLSTDAGKRALDQRLVIAAREVCGTASDVDLHGKNQVRQCRADVLAKARENGEQLASRGAPILIAAR